MVLGFRGSLTEELSAGTYCKLCWVLEIISRSSNLIVTPEPRAPLFGLGRDEQPYREPGAFHCSSCFRDPRRQCCIVLCRCVGLGAALLRRHRTHGIPSVSFCNCSSGMFPINFWIRVAESDFLPTQSELFDMAVSMDWGLFRSMLGSLILGIYQTVDMPSFVALAREFGQVERPPF